MPSGMRDRRAVSSVGRASGFDPEGRGFESLTPCQIVVVRVACNWRKGARTPEEAGMPLRFLPYVPSLFEKMLLQGRNVRADVHDWLSARLPRGSRLS